MVCECVLCGCLCGDGVLVEGVGVCWVRVGVGCGVVFGVRGGVGCGVLCVVWGCV